MNATFLATITAASLVIGIAHADEGMWTFDNFPTAALKSKYNVDIDASWLDRVRTSTVRLTGCTGSFVSADGLIMTNHHCSLACLEQLSTANNNILANGYLAGNRSEEKRCPTQIADVLVAMDNISDKVAGKIHGLDATAANEARKKLLTELEQACEEGSKQDKRLGPLKCESVTLYNGGQYFIYKYKRYTDVRLAFAPESSIASFGGDPDNFQYPRWDLDMSMLRAYEGGQPARPLSHLSINFQGPNAGDPVFVVGHPGSTRRLLSVSELLQQRKLDLPDWLLRNSELRGRLIQLGKQNDEMQRTVADQIQSLENTIKVRRKQLEALLDDRLIERKRDDEAMLRKSIGNEPWNNIDRALAMESAMYTPYTQLENGAGFGGQLFRQARTLVRAAAEREKPNTDRLREYADARLPRIEQQLAANTPFYPEREQATLTFALERMRELLGPDHPTVRRLLTKESPDALAKRLIANSKLSDAKERIALWKGGATAIAISTDPIIQLAVSLDEEARALRKQYEDQVEAPIHAASEKIAAARFASLGTSVYPDATFTLRINYGSVQGWRENGKDIAPFTTLDRAFARATGAEPFLIPKSWYAAKAKLDMNTRFNLSTNNDIVGGNSGSPLVNAQGEVVGLMFDGNIHSIAGAFWFDAEKNRAVAVHPAIIREALSKVYGGDALLREMQRH